MKIVVSFVSGGRSGQSLELPATDRVRIGRHPDNEISLDVARDLDVSGFHAELRRAGDGYLLVDLESRNGTFVAGQRVRSIPLRGETELRLGEHGACLRVTIVDDRPVPRKRRPLLLALISVSALLVAGATGLWWFARRPSVRSLAPAQCGVGSAELAPGRALALRAGVARIELPRGAVVTKGRLRAELRPDRSLQIVLEPKQALALAAVVTLPLPPGADLADPLGPRGPVAILESEGRRPLLLRPERHGPDWMQLRLPHFSTVQPSLYEDARAWMKRQGQTLAALVARHSPVYLRVLSIRRPKSFATDARLTQVEITVQAVAADGAGPDDAAGKRPFFTGLKVQVTKPDDSTLAALQLDANGRGTLVVTPDQPGPGKPPVMVVVLTLQNASDHQISTTTVTLPASKLWAQNDCVDSNVPGKPKRFTIYYLEPGAFSDAPDAGYQSKVGAVGSVPGRVLDACTALLTAHEAYRDRELKDPKNVPGEIDVWLQPWEESESGRYRDYIMLKTMSPDSFDAFKVSAAHELAHRFQHQYSYGYGGGWFHDASAEFLANKVFGYERDVARLTLSAQPDWLHQGLLSGAGTAAYGYASFLAYLSDQHRIEIGRLWPTASNASSWAGVLEAQLQARGSSLSNAFEKFAQSWLVDHRWGGGWTEQRVVDMLAETLRATPFAFSRGMLRVKSSLEVAYLSAGGLAISWRGVEGEGATIVGELTVPSGKGWIGLIPGETVNGQAGKPFALQGGGSIGAGTEKLRFELGPIKGALDRAGARVTYWYSDWSNASNSAGTLGVELWAIPQIVGLKLTEEPSKEKTLGWSASPLEKEKDLFKEYIVELRDGSGKRVYKAASSATGLTLPPGPVGKAQEACVWVRDAENHDGPEACVSLALGELEGRWRWVSHLGKLGGKEIAMEYWFDFGRPSSDGTIKLCTTQIWKVVAGSTAAPPPPRCGQQSWRIGGRGLLLTKGRWRADCELRRGDRLRLHCLVDEPFGNLGVNRLTADAEKQ